MFLFSLLLGLQLYEARLSVKRIVEIVRQATWGAVHAEAVCFVKD